MDRTEDAGGQDTISEDDVQKALLTLVDVWCKSIQVLDLHKQRQNQLKEKNDQAMARARDNESKLLA